MNYAQWLMLALGVLCGIAATALVSANRRGDRCGECKWLRRSSLCRYMLELVESGQADTGHVSTLLNHPKVEELTFDDVRKMAQLPPIAWDDLERLCGSEGPDLPGRRLDAEVDGMMGIERGRGWLERRH